MVKEKRTEDEMTDVATGRRVEVRGSNYGPWLRASADQIERMRGVLDKNGIRYRVLENLLSINGGPEMGTVRFGYEAEGDAIQAILDTIQ